jgi:hypothetical protein
MVFSCVFCESETVITTYLCTACRELKHIKLLYKDRFNEVITNCLLRTDDKIKLKEDIEKKTEVEKINMTLRTKPDVKYKV